MNTIVSKKTLAILAEAAVIVEALPDIEGLRCHEVARVVGALLSLEVQDGHYGHVEHSWMLVYQVSERRPFVLDPYCVGRLPIVQLVDTHMNLPRLYLTCHPRTDINEQQINELLQLLEVQGFRKRSAEQ
jgi:hypothetical protein